MAHPVSTVHPQYKRARFRWRRCRDCYDGTDAVKRAAELYLPPLSTKRTDDYPAFLHRANFYPAFSRTVEGMTGAVFNKPPQLIEAPPALEEQLKDVDLRHENLAGFAMKTLREVLISGRSLILVDAEDGRPYWRCYQAEDILSWKAHRGTITRLVLRETFEKAPDDDPYMIQEYWRIREVVLEDGKVMVKQYVAETPKSEQLSGWLSATYYSGFFGNYPAQTFNEDIGKVELVDETELTPTPMMEDEPFIPAFFANSDDMTVMVSKPPLLDLADVNLSHYRTSATLEHSLHYVAMPTPMVAGKNPLPQGISLGVGVWDLEEGAVADMLEVSGMGFEALETRIQKKQTEMAALGARMIDEPNRQAETAEAVRIKTGGDRSILMNSLTNVEQAITRVIQFHGQWAGIPAEEAAFTLNRDLVDRSLTFHDIQTLFKLYQAGELSKMSFFEALQGHIGIGRTFDQEQEAIESDEPKEPPEAPPVAPQPPTEVE